MATVGSVCLRRGESKGKAEGRESGVGMAGVVGHVGTEAYDFASRGSFCPCVTAESVDLDHPNPSPVGRSSKI